MTSNQLSRHQRSRDDTSESAGSKKCRLLRERTCALTKSCRRVYAAANSGGDVVLNCHQDDPAPALSPLFLLSFGHSVSSLSVGRHLFSLVSPRERLPASITESLLTSVLPDLRPSSPPLQRQPCSLSLLSLVWPRQRSHSDDLHSFDPSRSSLRSASPLPPSRPACSELTRRPSSSKPPTRITTLPNQLKVATNDVAAHIQSVGITVAAGSRYEVDETRGFSYMLAKLAYKVRPFHLPSTGPNADSPHVPTPSCSPPAIDQ